MNWHNEGRKTMKKILFICHGNICRSTMAEFVMKYLVEQKGLAGEFCIDSAATSTEEIGNRVHYGTRQKLAQVGIPCGDHRARQVTWQDYEEFDYLIGMDNANLRNMLHANQTLLPCMMHSSLLKNTLRKESTTKTPKERKLISINNQLTQKIHKGIWVLQK